MLAGFKNEKTLLSTLKKWGDLKSNLNLIHSLHYAYFPDSDLCKLKAENVFYKWDVISTSLVDTNEIQMAWQDIGWKEKARHTGVFFELAFVLDVAPQNIIGTHCQDVWFPNHAGLKEGRSWDLADAIFSGKGKSGGQNFWPATSGHSYNKIISPGEVLAKSRNNHHNEILVIGKPNIRTYPGLPATVAPKVKEILYVPKMQGNGASNFDKDKIPFIKQLQAVNPGVKVRKI